MRASFLQFAITAFVLLTIFLALFGDATRVSAGSLNFAGVVVRHDDGRVSYAYVGFEEAEISGIELLKRTGFDVVTVAFGGLGEGVCSIDEHGCPSTDCRKRVCQGPSNTDPFWQYFRQVEPGAWNPVALGASSTKVRDGDIDGWSWTPSEPNLPPLTLDEVALLAGYDGASFGDLPPGQPGSVFRRAGSAMKDDEQKTSDYLAGAGLLLAAVAAVGFVAWRRRRGAWAH